MALQGPTLVATAVAPAFETTCGPSNVQQPVEPLEEFHSACEDFFVTMDLDPREVHPLHAPSKPSLEDFRKTASAPVIMTPNPMMQEQVRANSKSRPVAHILISS